jgi:hypothetical protein
VLTEFWNTHVHKNFVSKDVFTESVEEEVRTRIRQKKVMSEYLYQESRLD